MRSVPYGHRKRHSFTLVETLVVVAIVAVLAALLLPGVNRARQTAAATKCLGNLHQIGIAAGLYSVDNDGYSLPGGWYLALNNGGYMPTNSSAWICPADVRPNKTSAGSPPISYGINTYWSGGAPQNWLSPKTRVQAIPSYYKTVFVCDATQYYVNPANTFAAFRHPAPAGLLGINVLYYDNHCSSVVVTNQTEFYSYYHY